MAPASKRQNGSPAQDGIAGNHLGNYGSGLMDHLLRRKNAILGVDFDPGALDNWRKKEVSVLYGDMADPDMHEQLPLKKAR